MRRGVRSNDRTTPTWPTTINMEQDKDLKKIIQESTFNVVNGDFVYAKVKSVPKKHDFFMLSIDQDEITVVTQNFQGLSLIEKNRDVYALIALNVSIPFYSVGFLAAISKALAEKGTNILIISTYSKDYVMVKKEKLPGARKVLKSLGLKLILSH